MAEGKTVLGIVVSLEEYIQLRKRDLKLEYLECNGVDNWSGYGDALNPTDYDDEDEEYEALSYQEEADNLEAQLRHEYRDSHTK